MIRLLVLIIIISSTALAEEVQRFEGMQSTKKDGVIVIEISPTADREKLRRQAEIDGQKGRIKAKRAELENKINERVRSYQEPPRYNYRSSVPRANPKSRSEYTKEFYEKQQRLLEQEERDHVGPLPKWKYDSIREREARYKREIEDAEKHPN